MPSALTAKTKILDALVGQLRLIGGVTSGTAATATVTLAGGSLDQVTLTNGGRGYEYEPQVTVVGDGVGAVVRAHKELGRDSVDSLTVVDVGSGYTTATITIAAPPLSFNSSVYSNVHRDWKYLQEINDFPTICMMTSRVNREHKAGDIRYDTLGITLRGYVMQDESIEACEALAEDIERVVDRLRDVKTAENAQAIVDSRVLSIRTDEGLFEPYGVVDVLAEITYDWEVVVNTGYLLLESGDGFIISENGDLLKY